MKNSIFVIFLLTITTIAFAAPIDFDNLHIASVGYGIAGHEGRPHFMAAYNNEIYFILWDDGTANPSKVYCYNPLNGWSNSTNHAVVAETAGRFLTLHQINNLLYFSDTLGNVYYYDGSTVTTMNGTPFSADDYVSSIVEYNGSIYFGTSISSIYRYDGDSYEQVYEVSDHSAIIDMATWEKDGYLYVSVGPEKVCCPPTGYTIRSNSGNIDSWETVFQNVYYTSLFIPTQNYLYTAAMDSAYGYHSTIRKSTDGLSFPVINQSNGEYKLLYGSLYHDETAYFFVNDPGVAFGYRIVDTNGVVSLVANQSWALQHAIELNGEIYALASSETYDPYYGAIPADIYLITTNTLTMFSPNGSNKLIAGQTETIRWNYLDDINNVKIEFSDNNGASWSTVDTNTASDGSYNWAIPQVTSNQCLIRISDVNDPNIYDISNNVFTIFECGLSSKADLDNNCKVDFIDFTIMAQDWLRNGNPFDAAYSEPLPIMWVYIDDPGVSGHEGFTGYISKYETTNAQYCQYLNAAKSSGAVTVSGNYVVGASGSYSGQNYYNLAGSGYTGYGATNGGASRINWTGSSFTVDGGFEDHPVTYVSWYGATAFCNYYGYQLPTRLEWQAVADYDGSYTYGCGTTINNGMANYSGSTHPNGTTTVGAFGTTHGYEMCDMAGNVFEWTATNSGSSYFDCGGSFYDAAQYCEISFSRLKPPIDNGWDLGFRVCR